MYYNQKYKTFSFYICVREEYNIKFERDRSKPVIIKRVLFYVRHNISKK